MSIKGLTIITRFLSDSIVSRFLSHVWFLLTAYSHTAK